MTAETATKIDVVESREASIEIAEALGIDLPNLKRVSIVIQADSFIEVHVNYYPTGPDIKKLLPVLKKYHLVEVKEKNES